MVSGRVAIVGATGQLGADLVRCFGSRALPLSHADVDVRDAARLSVVIPAGTDWVINAAAFHQVDQCEDDPGTAFAVNALGAQNAAAAAARAGAGIVFISTDYVFDGAGESAYREGDPVNPLNVYGVSKVAGEMLTRLANPRHLIVRTAYLFGQRPSGKGWNLVTGTLDQAQRGGPLRVARDVVFSPTSTAHLAAKLVEVLEAGVTGVVHLTNAGSCTREEFTRFLLGAAGLDAPVVSIRAAELPWRARRPLRSPLASEVLGRAGLDPLPDWREAVRDYLREASVHRGDRGER
jgi:dTDP-4-dehydrorhamnose reductase